MTRSRSAGGSISPVVAVFVCALAALWRFTPLAQRIDVGRMTSWAEEFADSPWTPLAVVAAYVPAAVVMLPRPLITVFAVVALGPWLSSNAGRTPPAGSPCRPLFHVSKSA